MQRAKDFSCSTVMRHHAERSFAAQIKVRWSTKFWCFTELSKAIRLALWFLFLG